MCLPIHNSKYFKLVSKAKFLALESLGNIICFGCCAKNNFIIAMSTSDFVLFLITFFSIAFADFFTLYYCF